MQTLISVFDDRANARKAVDRLMRAGFGHQDIHLREGGGEEARNTDRGVLDSLGHFFVSLFGEDRGEATARSYRKSIHDGHSVVLVDAHDDGEAETAAVILHEQGAIEVDDQETEGGTPTRPGVRTYERMAGPTLRDLARQRQLRQESLLAERAGQVTKELRHEREDRAYASMTHVGKDRPR
jgi:hypothetical protein